LRSVLDGPAVGRYLHEQVGLTARLLLTGVENFGGGTSITGHHWGMARGEHRKRRAAVLLETWNRPAKIRLEPGRWREYLALTGVFEDIPQERNRVLIDDANPKRARIEWFGHSEYAMHAIASFEKDLEGLLEGLPIEKVTLGKPRATEGHILGSARMGDDPKDSV